jgi:hypothetical protein
MKTSFQTEIYSLPSYWASYLINGDASGMDDDEQAQCDAFLESLPYGFSCVDYSEESDFRHSNDAGTLAGDCLDYTFMRSIPYKRTLERWAFDLLENDPGPFDVIAYELTHDGQGWSVNTPFRIASQVDLSGVMEAMRGRWEVFKANYSPRATVASLSDIGEGSDYEIEAEGIPFLQVRPSETSTR